MLQRVDRFLIVFVCLIPFGAFIFPRLADNIDIWYAQGHFVQVGILALFSLHIFKRNKPLGSLTLWVGGLTVYYWYQVLIKYKVFAHATFYPFFNFLCMILFYEFIVNYCNKESLRKLLTYFTIPITLILIYCILQKLGLDQFHNPTSGLQHDEFVGTIGNPSHLANYLCVCLPVFFILKNPLKKLGVLATLIIILLTGSFSGLVIALIVVIFYSLFHRIFTLKEVIGILIIGVLYFVWKFQDIAELTSFLNLGGRVEHWVKLYEVFKEKSIIGFGLGRMNIFAQQEKFAGWRHAHNEFYHFAVELGLIGVGIIIWGIIDYFRIFKKLKKDPTTVILTTIFLAFILTSMVGFPCHLWVISSIGMLAYGGLFCAQEKKSVIT